MNNEQQQQWTILILNWAANHGTKCVQFWTCRVDRNEEQNSCLITVTKHFVVKRHHQFVCTIGPKRENYLTVRIISITIKAIPASNVGSTAQSRWVRFRNTVILNTSLRVLAKQLLAFIKFLLRACFLVLSFQGTQQHFLRFRWDSKRRFN